MFSKDYVLMAILDWLDRIIEFPCKKWPDKSIQQEI